MLVLDLRNLQVTRRDKQRQVTPSIQSVWKLIFVMFRELRCLLNLAEVANCNYLS
jgi:hypothetical protein